MHPDSVRVLFADGQDVRKWRAQHSAGLVPDSWPYGLNKISSHGRTVTAAEVRPLNLASLSIALLGLKRQVHGGVALSWEENLALRMVSQYPAGRMFSGIIWVTDRVMQGTLGIKDKLIASALRQADGLWCLSEPQTRIAQDWLGKDAPKVQFLRFGIDHRFFSYCPYPQKPFLFSAGSDRDRDAKTLYSALEIVHRALPKLEIVVQSNSTLPVPTGVIRIPTVTHSQLREYYRRASLVMIATKPNFHVSGMTVALESMSIGRPVVVNSTPGMDEYVETDKAGLVVPIGQPDEMAQRTIALLNDPDLAANMGLYASKRVANGFTTDNMAAQISRWI
jgi:glycosyltransferase involved in cell wall biosynthesis